MTTNPTHGRRALPSFRLVTILGALLLLAFAPRPVHAAVPHWAPISGTLNFEVYAHYGEQGVPNPPNHPSVNPNYGGTAYWNDDEGGLWIFGGSGRDASNVEGLLGDLWRYDPGSRIWTWMSGSGQRNTLGVYGERGIPDAANRPGARYRSASWRDAEGCLWLFGGKGSGSYDYGELNDLWKYEPRSGLWTWMAGSDAFDQNGIYGTMGVADPSNIPGGRHDSSSWVDASGRFWLFGGYGYSTTTTYRGVLSDLWVYDPRSGHWTWMAGSRAVGQPGVYGTLGVSSPSNTPGGRDRSVVWSDPQGRFWLFGGFGADVNASGGYLSDLWMLDPETAEWTWMAGPQVTDQLGVYGELGVPDAANTPGARRESLAWAGQDGNLWLYGGAGYGQSNYGTLSDLWRYSPEAGLWTWMKGSTAPAERPVHDALGEFSEANTPGARREAACWVDAEGNFQLADPTNGDFWELDPTRVQWAALRARPDLLEPGIYGAQGVADPANRPGRRGGATTWTDAAGGRWMFGGIGFSATSRYPVKLNDLWRFNPTDGLWTWVEGSTIGERPGFHGEYRIPAPGNTPGARHDPASWIDSQGRLWLFGGYGRDGIGKETFLNDLWCFDPASGDWVWLKGPSIAASVLFGVYGTMGVPHPTNNPGPRFDSVSWQDRDGGFWLFGGSGYDSTTGAGELNDLWHLDPETLDWTWISGSSIRNQLGVFARRGAPDPLNMPGARTLSVSWLDDEGNLWLFGGKGYDGTGYAGLLDDLWKFDPSTREWTWVAGSSRRDRPAVRGQQGRAAPDNTPGGRIGAVSWTGEDGLFWLFGGDTSLPLYRPRDGLSDQYGLSDLWCFDPALGMWSWVKGPAEINRGGVAHATGKPHPANNPGARRFANAWSDSRGELWLFGGDAHDLEGYQIVMGDMWRATFTKPYADARPGPGDLIVLTEFTDVWTARLQGGGLAAPAHLGFTGFRHDTAANWSTLGGDFDGDGFLDLVTVTDAGEAWTATFESADAFSVPHKQSTGWRADPAQGHLVLAGDVDGDGLTDLLQLRPDGDLAWSLNNAGALGEPTELQVTQLRHDPAAGLHVFAHDVDGDGRTDLIQADNAAGTLAVARSLQTGFDALLPWSPDGWGHDPDARRAVHFGDFNGDARADVLEVRDSAMRVALSTESGLAPAAPAGTLGFHDDPLRGEGWWVFPGDIDQDGFDDLIQINEFGEAWVARSLGAGAFGPPMREAQLGFHHKPDGRWQVYVGRARE